MVSKKLIITIFIISFLIPPLTWGWHMTGSDEVYFFASAWVPFYFTITIVYKDDETGEGRCKVLIARTILIDVHIFDEDFDTVLYLLRKFCDNRDCTSDAPNSEDWTTGTR